VGAGWGCVCVQVVGWQVWQVWQVWLEMSVRCVCVWGVHMCVRVCQTCGTRHTFRRHTHSVNRRRVCLCVGVLGGRGVGEVGACALRAWRCVAFVEVVVVVESL
jgi:hypothetical protein